MARTPKFSKNEQPSKANGNRKNISRVSKVSSKGKPVSQESDDLVFAVCKKFFDGNGMGRATDIANQIKEEMKEMRRDDITREKIYPLLWEGFRRRFLLLQAPVETQLREKLEKQFRLKEYLEEKDEREQLQKLCKDKCKRELTVVNVSGATASTHVSATAADKVIELIDQVNEEKKALAIRNKENPDDVRVHLGFGAGFAAEEVAQRLAARTATQLPKLTLHAISPGGFYIDEQQKGPTTYFAFFTNRSIPVRCIGYFSTPVEMNNHIEAYRANPSFRISYDHREEIDILVTSLASANDKHGLLRRYFDYLKANGFIDEDVLQTLTDKDWVGDLLFQPYSKEGPIFPDTVRSMALFDLEELKKFSEIEGKRIVVIGGPCNDCAQSKTGALLPLLTRKSLRFWTHLIMDSDTARELLEDKSEHV